MNVQKIIIKVFLISWILLGLFLDIKDAINNSTYMILLDDNKINELTQKGLCVIETQHNFNDQKRNADDVRDVIIRKNKVHYRLVNSIQEEPIYFSIPISYFFKEFISSENCLCIIPYIILCFVLLVVLKWFYKEKSVGKKPIGYILLILECCTVFYFLNPFTTAISFHRSYQNVFYIMGLTIYLLMAFEEQFFKICWGLEFLIITLYTLPTFIQRTYICLSVHTFSRIYDIFLILGTYLLILERFNLEKRYLLIEKESH